MLKKPFWYRVGEGVAESIPFIAEFVITAPVGLGTGKIASGLAEKALKKMAIRNLEGKLAKIVIKGTGVLIGSFFQTIANPLDVQKNILEHGMALVNLQANSDGSFTAEVKAKDESKATTIWKGFVSSYINVFTERLGGHVLPFLGVKTAKAFGRFLPMSARNSVVTTYLKSTAKALEKYAGFHGILGEYEEELYAQLLESLLKGEQIKWNWEDQLVTFTTVAVTSSTMRGLQSTVIAYEILRTFQYQGSKVVLPIKVFERLIQLQSLADLADFKNSLSEMNPNPKVTKLALDLAAKVLEVETNISTAGESQASQIPKSLRSQTTQELIQLNLDLYQAKKELLNSKTATPQTTGQSPFTSVNLKGENEDALLSLYNPEQVNIWIEETE
ncbi:MAG: hypothetical protein HC880_03230, partial [Bacteroidia bacterium]|nr:hypothetical protein [Bacteroidia bacterium]